MSTFKILLLGDGGVGKTTLLKRHLDGEFIKKYDATLGVEVYTLTFQTNYEQITLSIWDCAGQEKFSGILNEHYKDSMGAIVMFDLTSKLSFKNVNQWIKSINNKIPIVICGNKCDIGLDNIKVSEADITSLVFNKYQYYHISAKSNHNYEKPFLYLARQLTGHDDLLFIESSDIVYPDDSSSNIVEPGAGEIVEETSYCSMM